MNNLFLGGKAIKLANFIHRYQLAFQSIYRSINDMMKQHVHTDITTEQFTVLQFISQHEKVTSTQIAQVMGVGKSSITALVNRLVGRKMIIRQRDKQDRRIVHLTLTDEAVHVVQETEKAIHNFLEEKLSHFNLDDIKRFLLALEKLSTLMEDEEGVQL